MFIVWLKKLQTAVHIEREVFVCKYWQNARSPCPSYKTRIIKLFTAEWRSIIVKWHRLLKMMLSFCISSPQHPPTSPNKTIVNTPYYLSSLNFVSWFVIESSLWLVHLMVIDLLGLHLDDMVNKKNLTMLLIHTQSANTLVSHKSTSRATKILKPNSRNQAKRKVFVSHTYSQLTMHLFQTLHHFVVCMC